MLNYIKFKLAAARNKSEASAEADQVSAAQAPRPIPRRQAEMEGPPSEVAPNGGDNDRISTEQQSQMDVESRAVNAAKRQHTKLSNLQQSLSVVN